MYDTFIGVSDMAKVLGICRAKTMKLCEERPCGFPVVRVGNRYRAEESKLLAWKDDFYSGKFDLNI